MNTTTSEIQLTASEATLSSFDEEKTFAVRFSASMLITLFASGYVWTLAITYPAIALLPILFFAVALAGHFVMAVQLIKRLQTLDDTTKNTALVWMPFIGLAYALPAVMDAELNEQTVDSRKRGFATKDVEMNAA
ncbi:MAG: hypothetical protein LAT84_08770 [Balneolia bacterium]|nr:hypothetical protein [Balneolia bacterium]